MVIWQVLWASLTLSRNHEPWLLAHINTLPIPVAVSIPPVFLTRPIHPQHVALVTLQFRAALRVTLTLLVFHHTLNTLSLLQERQWHIRYSGTKQLKWLGMMDQWVIPSFDMTQNCDILWQKQHQQLIQATIKGKSRRYGWVGGKFKVVQVLTVRGDRKSRLIVVCGQLDELVGWGVFGDF